MTEFGWRRRAVVPEQAVHSVPEHLLGEIYWLRRLAQRANQNVDKDGILRMHGDLLAAIAIGYEASLGVPPKSVFGLRVEIDDSLSYVTDSGRRWYYLDLVVATDLDRSLARFVSNGGNVVVHRFDPVTTAWRAPEPTLKALLKKWVAKFRRK